jgi:serine/threonine-protein kinase SRPK3
VTPFCIKTKSDSTLQHVALKIIRADATKGGPNQPKETDILQHVALADPSHPGHRHVVKLLDSFMHTGPNGEHSCIVFEALGESVLKFQRRSESGRLSPEMVRSIARQILLGLDYLHRSCRLVHTGTH